MRQPDSVICSQDPYLQLLPGRKANEMRRLCIFLVAIVLFVCTLSLSTVLGAGGTVEGKVVDPKGAVIVGAQVTATDAFSNQSYKATTDAQGHYKIEGLPAGVYSITVSASGFAEARPASVKV